MKRTLILAVAAAVGMLVVSPATAHHAFSAEYDIAAPVTLTGTLAKLEWINPHSWVHVDVKNADGTVTTWAVETMAANSLLRAGMHRSDFKIGTAVVVSGYKAKSGKPVAAGRSLKTPDGRDFLLGSPETPNR